MRTKEARANWNMFEWKFRPADPNRWVAALEDKLPFRLPTLYRELITRYRFAESEVGPVTFLATTGTPVWNELVEVIFRDKQLYPALLEKGLIQFGNQAAGGYDPTCFDVARPAADGAPIVQLDHE